MSAAFWGKARPVAGGASPMHPLPAHMLDVAAVATLLPQAQGLGVPGRTLGFLVALHDIGKFSRPFQAQAPEHWPTTALGPWPAAAPPPGPKHDTLGAWMLRGPLARALDAVLPLDGGWRDAHRGALIRGLAGHHGRPPETRSPRRADPTVLCQGCLDAAAGCVAAMLAAFAPPPLARPDDRGIARLGWQLAGLTALADWIGSRQAWFPYAAPEAVQDPAAYLWDVALPRAAAAIAAAGLAAVRPAAFGGVRGLFPMIERPSPVQAWAERVELPDGPVLAVIEDLTGSGKTEAAMTLAHRLIADGRAAGLFLALPTMATANAMYARLAAAYRGLFAAEAHPSLALAHGHALLDPRFLAAIPVERGVAAPRSADPADEPAEAQCAAWLAEDRRRALLAQVGVGTVDQALLAVLPVRHAALRLAGLAGKVLILDEVHAFDPYMQREILTLLEFHAALGGSVVVLSATLPQALRQRLVDAFCRGLGAAPRPVTREDYTHCTKV